MQPEQQGTAQGASMSLIQKTFNVSPTAFQAQGLRGDVFSPLNKEIDHLGSKALSDGVLLLFRAAG